MANRTVRKYLLVALVLGCGLGVRVASARDANDPVFKDDSPCVHGCRVTALACKDGCAYDAAAPTDESKDCIVTCGDMWFDCKNSCDAAEASGKSR